MPHQRWRQAVARPAH